MPQDLPTPLPCSLVRLRGERWRVEDVVRFEGCAICRLQGRDPANRHVTRTVILPFDRVEPVRPSSRVSHVGRRRWVARLRGHLLEATPFIGLRAAASGVLDLLPYQLEPALACLAGATRLLLADEVGLGKTIQAGLILAEIFGRSESVHALVLAPSTLCAQWVGELVSRFRLPAVHLDARSVRRVACQCPPEVSPWAQVRLAVSSFDYVKQPEVFGGIASLQWDALVVDEAHMAALAHDRARAVRHLAARSRRVILMTATPQAGDAAGFRSLCDVGALPNCGPLLVFRRTRASLGFPASRRVLVLPVRLSPAERRMHEALQRYTESVWRESARSGTAAGARLAMVVLRKRAASGPASLEASLARRLAWLSDGAADLPAEAQLALPLDPADDEGGADDQPAAVLAAPGLGDAATERRRLSALIDLARTAIPHDAKARILGRLLARAREPAIVFTEYRDTLARLAARLEAWFPLALLHGGLDRAARLEAVEAFTSGKARLLLATDAAAHGLNLQAGCRLVVDVELPWMPARLEQRIGRVDRIGQRRIVHAVHLVARGTAEEQILARLLLRVGRDHATLGWSAGPFGAVTEMDVARRVFGEAGTLSASCDRGALDNGEGPREGRDWVRELGHAEPARVERERLERVRSLAAHSDLHALPAGTPRSRACWTVMRARRSLSDWPPGLLCLFAVRCIDDRGSLVEAWMVPISVALSDSRCRFQGLARDLPRLLPACRDRLEALALSLADGHLDALREQAATRSSSLAVREAAMLAASEADHGPMQPGLFDLRRVKAEDERRHRRDGDVRESAAHLSGLHQSRALQLAGSPELVLVLGIGR